MYDSSLPAPIIFLIYGVALLIGIVVLITTWKIYTKAGKPGWASIVPIYNTYIFLKIINRPWWWIFLYFIPFVSIVVSVINAIDLAQAFKKSTTFGIMGLALFSPIGYFILAFGDSTYIGRTKAPELTTLNTPQPQNPQSAQTLPPQTPPSPVQTPNGSH